MDRLYEVGLSLVPGIGDVLAKHLISYLGSAQNIFNTPYRKLIKVPGIGVKNATALKDSQILYEAEKVIEMTRREGIKILFYTDPDYPERLKKIYRAPVILYFEGNADLNCEKIVGIVGTRNSTPYGQGVVEKIIDGLIPYRPLIVSGLAYGIDVLAHMVALKNGLPTLGVLAGGLNKIYPGVHRPIAIKMKNKGGLVSEKTLDTQPEAHFFPTRNRIIAGISDVIIVVEAAKKGGALITAQIADSYDKDVFAIPGTIFSKYSEGCNHLIRDHKAHIFTEIKDLAYIMNWDLPISHPKKSVQNDSSLKLNVNELKIVQLLSDRVNGMLIDEISWKSQISISLIASLLLSLEFKGIVKPLPGKKYILN